MRGVNEFQSFSRVFLLDRLNEPFLLGTSPWNAQQKRVLRRIAIVVALSLLFGIPISYVYRGDARTGRYLLANGNRATASVVDKQIDTQSEGRNSCTLVYEFEAPQGSAPNAPRSPFKREQDVSNKLCESTAKSAAVAILYDPRDPSVSILASSLRSPLYPAWLVWTWWAGSFVILGWLGYSLVMERLFAAKAILIRGTISSLEIDNRTDDKTVELRYSFQSPKGSNIEGVGHKSKRETNLEEFPGTPKPGDPVAVLYLAEDLFTVL